MATVFETPADVEKAVGKSLGSSDWIEITQERIDRFAKATEDFQWIHTDPERAKAGPFGKTIAHGYLTQSLASHFLCQVVNVRGIAMAINYGMDRVRGALRRSGEHPPQLTAMIVAARIRSFSRGFRTGASRP